MRENKGMNDFSKIPKELRSLDRWVCWKFQTVGDRQTKVPYIAGKMSRASSTDESTWRAFEDAVSAVDDGLAEGIGFVLGAGFVGIDLDACRDPKSGKRSADAEEILSGMKSYAEASPSGKGIHIIVRGTLPKGWRRLGPIEIYSEGRYFTMTGEKIGIWSDVEDRTDVLTELHRRLAEDPNRPKNVRATPDKSNRLERSFDSSKGEKDKYKAWMDRVTGKAGCNCLGWKNRMRSGHPCWHVNELANELGMEVTS
jgi:putative DNA primase/helicase